ncbi:MAG: hypothetical protein NTX29_10350 [Actinobacteria bacterium]|nr:hypothetical protein [Actinomycetota bacterium]
MAALATGSTLALANKESLIIGGSLVTSAAAPGRSGPRSRGRDMSWTVWTSPPECWSAPG